MPKLPLLNMTFPYTIWTDGAARGRHNGHGPSSAGFVVRSREGELIYAAAKALGPTTNNHAEYVALIMALDWVLANLPEDDRYVHFKSDSEFMVRQINKIYAVNHPDMRKLYYDAMSRLDRLPGYKVEHVKREFNREADAMCNRVLDAEKSTGVTFVEDNPRSSDAPGRTDRVGIASNDGPAEGAGTEGTSSGDAAGDPRLRIRGREVGEIFIDECPEDFSRTGTSLQ